MDSIYNRGAFMQAALHSTLNRTILKAPIVVINGALQRVLSEAALHGTSMTVHCVGL